MTWALVNPASGYRTFSRFVSFRVRPSILTSTDVSLATFANHLFRALVVAKTLERWRAQLAAPRPLDEFEVGDDLRLDEVRCARRRGARVERALVDADRLQHVVQLVERRVGEACPDLAGVDELGAVVVADEQSARIAPALALALEPAADHKLLAVVVLDLDPRAASAPGF